MTKVMGIWEDVESKAKKEFKIGVNLIILVGLYAK